MAQADLYEAVLNAVNSRPYIAGIVSRGFYPPTLLCIRLLPVELALVVLTAFHLCVGAGCSYLALRRAFRVSVSGAVLGSATYVFGQVFATRRKAIFFAETAVR